MDLKAIKQFYSEVSTSKLEELVDKIHGLQPEVIPLLHAELKVRNELQLAERVEYFISNPWNENISEETMDKIMEEIEERKNMGEDLESIKLDLKSRLGIENYEKILERLSENQTSISDDLYIQAASEVFRMQEMNLNDSQIKKQLKSYGVPQNISEQIIIQSTEDKDALAKAVYDKLKRRTQNDLIFGTIILVIGLAITIGSFAMDTHYIIAYGAILVGGVKTLRGLIARSELKH
jgi:hypothetical protein